MGTVIELSYEPFTRSKGGYLSVRLAEVTDGGVETTLERGSATLHGEYVLGVVDKFVDFWGYRRVSDYTFDDVYGFEQSADVRPA